MDNSLKNRLTIIVNSCDAYSDVWDLFFEAMRTQWQNCPYNIMLNTEKKQYSYKDMQIVVHNYHEFFRKRDRWGARYRDTLQSVETTYVLPFLEDYVLTEPVNNPELLETIMDFMDQNPNVTVVYLDAFPKETFLLEGSKELPGFGKMPRICAYKLSTATAVWRRESLISLIRDFESPWEWELNASYRACMQSCGDFYAWADAINFFPRNIMFSIPYGGVIRRGLWNIGTEQLLDKYGVQIDLTKRGIMDPDNPFRQSPIYSLRQNYRRDLFKPIFWKNVFLRINSRYRFYKSIL